MATIQQDQIANLHDRITVHLDKADYFPAFEKKLKEYSKTANIPGFRKGHVPAGMVKKMYGQALFSDMVYQTATGELYKHLAKDEESYLGQPMPADEMMPEFDMNNAGDVSMSFEIGRRPQVKMPDLASMNLTREVVDVNDKMVDEEVERLRLRGGKSEMKDVIEGENDMIGLTFTEVDESGNDTGFMKEKTLVLKVFNANVQEMLKGKKVSDQITLKLSDMFEGDRLHQTMHDLELDAHDPATAEKRLRITVDAISTLQPRELNEEFFAEVMPGADVKTEADFRTKIREDIETFWKKQSSVKFQNALLDKVIEETKAEFPKTFLTKMLANDDTKTRTPEQAEADYPEFEKQLKWELISNSLINEHQVKVSEEDVRENLRGQFLSYFGGMSGGGDMSWLDAYVDRTMQDKKQVDQTRHRIMTEKIAAILEQSSKPRDKKVSLDHFTHRGGQAGKHTHQH